MVLWQCKPGCPETASHLSLVRPHLEYACHVWNPHVARRPLKNVQKLACRIAIAHWDNSYDDMLDLVNLQPLHELWIHARLGLLYRIL